MRVADGIRRSGIGIEPHRTVHEAAAVMEQTGVGALAVIDGDRLVGVVTDRDLVRRVLAPKVPPDARVDAVMSTPAVTIDAAADLHQAFALFRSHALRRLAVVRGEQFIGMITVDDLLIDLAGHLSDLVGPVTAEVMNPQHDSPLPADG